MSSLTFLRLHTALFRRLDQSHTTNGKSTNWLRSQARKMVVAPFKELNPNAPECPQPVGLSALLKGALTPFSEAYRPDERDTWHERIDPR